MKNKEQLYDRNVGCMNEMSGCMTEMCIIVARCEKLC